MNPEWDEELLRAAWEVRKRAHAPFSKFKVGAALRDDTNRIFTGCNVENTTYGLSMCAERVAIFKAVSEAAGKIEQVVVVADTNTLTPPCGACRQLLWEFCRDAELVLANLSGQREKLRMQQIFPRPFDDSFL